MKKVIGFVKFVRIVGSWTATVTSQFRKFCTVVTYQVHRLNYCIWTWGGEWALSLRILVFTYVRWVVAGQLHGDKRRRIGFWNHSWTTFHHVYEQYFFITIFQPLCFRYRRPHMQAPSSPMWLRKAESHSLPIAAFSLMIETTKKACCHQVHINAVIYRFFRSSFFATIWSHSWGM